MNLDKCMDEVSQVLKKFLAHEGGYDNGYYTHVEGMVDINKKGVLNWQTPKAKDELTKKGYETRGEQLYQEIAEIMSKYEVEKLLIRSEDVGYGSMETYVVFVEETKKRVWLH